MTCDANKLFLATAAAFAVVWVICAAFVALMPGAMMTMSGHMVHADLEMTHWTLSWGGFFIGLIAWSLIAGAIAWLIGTIYNGLLGEGEG